MLFTDGLTELTPMDREGLGERRLQRLLRQCLEEDQRLSAKKLMSHIVAEFYERNLLEKSISLEDDLAMICMSVEKDWPGPDE